MQPDPTNPEFEAAWEAQDEALAAAEKAEKITVVMGIAPTALMGLFSILAIRKQRRAHRRAWDEAVTAWADAGDPTVETPTLELDPPDGQAPGIPQAELAALYRLEGFLPEWAALERIDGRPLVVDRHNRRLVCTLVNLGDVLERTDEELQAWADSIARDRRDY